MVFLVKHSFNTVVVDLKPYMKEIIPKMNYINRC